MSERRLAAIMFTDIVGYTALMGSDEDHAFEVLASNHTVHETLIAKYNGTLIKEVGDGTLASFPLASDAVRCAIDIQKEAKNLNIPLKIGIHEGEMVFTNADVLGDGVNIASRIQDETISGCITISESVYRDIKNKHGIQAEFIRKKYFKNVDGPINIYNILCDQKVQSNSNEKSELFKSTQGTRKKYLRYFSFAILLIIVIILVTWSFKQTDFSELVTNEKLEGGKKGIAVLPFRSIGNEQESAFLADGIMETIISHLSKIDQLKVISRTSVEQFRETLKSSTQIAKELDVDYLLEGSAQKSETQFRINVKLINAVEDYNVWTENYDKEMTDIFQTQSEIANEVANAMKIHITNDEIERISYSSTSNIEANDLYVKGRYYWNKRTEKDLFYCLELFEKAVDLDPRFCLAWAGKADAYNMLCGYGHIPFKEGHSKAAIAAKNALKYNPKLAEAYASLGWVYAFNDHDWEKSKIAFESALKYQPSYSTAHSWYAWTLAAQKDFELADQHIQIARSLDPLSNIIRASSGWVTYILGNYEQARAHFHSAIKLNPEFPRFYLWLGHTFMANEEYDSAIFYLEKALNLEKGNPQYLSNLGFCLGIAQRHKDAEKIYDELNVLCDLRFVSSYDIALSLLGINEIELAIEHFEKAYFDRDIWVTFLSVDPRFNYLHSNNDFQKIVNKTGLVIDWID